MNAGDGGLHHQQGQVSPRAGRDDRTTDARRAIHDEQLAAFVQGPQSPLLLDQGHQLTRVLLRGEEMGMKERAETGIGAEPAPRRLLFHANRLYRTLVETGGAPFAGDVIHPIGVIIGDNRLEATDLGADAASSAEFGINDSYLPTGEIVLFQLCRIQHQFQVGGVHVGIGQNDKHLFRRQVGQRRRDRRLAGTPFATENDELSHRLVSSSATSTLFPIPISARASSIRRRVRAGVFVFAALTRSSS